MFFPLISVFSNQKVLLYYTLENHIAWMNEDCIIQFPLPMKILSSFCLNVVLNKSTWRTWKAILQVPSIYLNVWKNILKISKYLSSTYLGLSIWRYSNIQINWREKSTMIMFQEENNYINVAMKSQFLWVFKVLMLWNVLLGKIVYIHEI